MSNLQPHVMLVFSESTSDSRTLVVNARENNTIFPAYSQDEFDINLCDNQIHCIITIGNKGWKEFEYLFVKYGNMLNRIWVHRTFSDIKAEDIPQIAQNNLMKSLVVNPNNDFISYYVTAYNSKELILRPYNSLLAQSNKNWELVIIDDSDNIETEMIIRTIKDFRVRYFRSKHSGFIGEVKNWAARLCNGFVICELDHDDEVMPDLNETLFKVYKSDPDIMFVSTNCSEPYDDNDEHVCYGDMYDFGYGGYYTEYHGERKRLICTSGLLNVTTVNSIVGVPNHIRTWRAKDLRDIGFNNPNLYVADDYEVILRTIIHCSENNKKMIHLPILGYLQYRNRKIGNHTFKRNKEIQKLWKYCLNSYKPKLDTIFEGVQRVYDNYDGNKCTQIWKMPWDWQPKNLNEANEEIRELLFPGRVSVIISTYKRRELLQRAIDSIFAQDYQNFEILIVGDKCPELDDFMKTVNDPKVRYHNLTENFNNGGATPKNYALRVMARTNLICYLDDDNIFKPNHLSTLVNAIKDVQYSFSGFEMGDYEIKCREPRKCRIDTSSFMHRFSLIHKYGYWKTHKEGGYCHDWELVSRWSEETWKATGEITMVYNMQTASLNNPKAIYEMYDDQ